MAITKKILAKAKARPSAATASTKKVSKPLPDESSDSESDAQDLQDEGSAEGESGDSEDEEEEDDVTEEALQRMMELLGDVDPEELALLEAEAAAESGSEGEEEQDQDDDEDEDDEDMYNLEDGSDAEEEGMYEDLQEEDTDITPVERTTVNDKVALARVLASFKTETTFFDTLSLTYPHALDIPDAENDLERELQFYKQSLWAVQHAEGLFAAASLPFTRPDDYFAEMLKTDAHMSLIRQSLLNESAGIKASEDARKLRDAKKFGKKVQVERLKEREKEKKEVGKRLESLKKKRKAGDGGFASTEDFDIALEDAISGPAKRVKTNESERGGRGGRGGARGGGTARGISRRGRDSKFGNPTTSRRPKENNDKMDGEGSGFSRGRGRGGSRGGRGGGRGGGDRGGSRGASKQRLGKSRRN